VIALAAHALVLRAHACGSSHAFAPAFPKSLSSTQLVRYSCAPILRCVHSTNACAGLHGTLAHHDVNSIKNQLNFEHYVGRVEATHFEDSSVFVTFSALVGHKPVMSALDPQLQALVEDGQFQGPTQEVYVLDSDTDDLPGKLEVYDKKMASTFYEHEASPFMKATLNLAAELAQQKEVSPFYLDLREIAVLADILPGYPSGPLSGALACHSYLGGCRIAVADVFQSHSPTNIHQYVGCIVR
jgi:hypothetical protein